MQGALPPNGALPALHWTAWGDQLCAQQQGWPHCAQWGAVLPGGPEAPILAFSAVSLQLHSGGSMSLRTLALMDLSAGASLYAAATPGVLLPSLLPTLAPWMLLLAKT